MSGVKQVVASAFLIFASAGAGQAEPDEVWEITYGFTSFDVPPHDLSTARWKWQAAHADPRELAKSKVEAARILYAARQYEFLRGRSTLQFFLQASLNLFEAERAVAASEAEQLIALNRYWARARMAEDVNRWRYLANKIQIYDYMQSKYERLRAEMWLVEARAMSAKGMEGTYADWVSGNPLDSRATPTSPTGEVPDLAVNGELPNSAQLGALGQQLLAQVAPDTPYDFSQKQLAQAAFEVNDANPRELAKAMVEAAQIAYGGREKEFLAGRGTLDFLLSASRELLAAERLASDNAIDQQAALERYCALATFFYDVSKERFEAGRVPIQDCADTNYKLLEGELWLADIRAKSRKPAIGGVLRAPQMQKPETNWPQCSLVPDVPAHPLESREFARAKFEAMSTDAKALARERYYAANVGLGARFKEFLAGRGTLDFLLDSSLRVMEAQLALSDNKVSQLAAIERHWIQTMLAEDINWGRYAASRIPIQDCAWTMYERLKVELRLAEAKK
jgi:hypothetical protein